MKTGAINQIDLREKRESIKLTQRRFAELIGIDPSQMSRYETNRVSIPFHTALRFVEVLGSLTVSMDGREFLIEPKNGDEEEAMPALNGIGWAGKSVHAAQQAREFIDWWGGIGENLIEIHTGNGGDAFLRRFYKEAHEAIEALTGVMNEGRKRHPHLVQAGVEMAKHVAQARREGRCTKEILERGA